MEKKEKIVEDLMNREIARKTLVGMYVELYQDNRDIECLNKISEMLGLNEQDNLRSKPL